MRKAQVVLNSRSKKWKVKESNNGLVEPEGESIK